MILKGKNEGLQPNTLGQMIDFGAPLVPCYNNGMPVNVGEPGNGATRDRDILRWHWKRGIRRYEFTPGDIGLVALSVFDNRDCHGLAELRERYCMWGENWDGLLERIPCYTQTKTGYDILYRWRGDELAIDELSRHVLVIHTGGRIVAPGSVVENHPVLLFGRINATPEIPQGYLQHVTRADEVAAL